jgi:hypothetical protein
MFMKSNDQMEMSLDPKTKCERRPFRSRERRQRAQWWFNQMRMVVDSAIDWKTTTPAQSAEQISMGLKN